MNYLWNKISFLAVALIISMPVLAGGGNNLDKVEDLSESLEQAMEKRNFQAAREVMEEMIPLMKEIIKNDKKKLSDLKKMDEPEIDPETFEKSMDRKNELYDSLKKLVNISPAALRVKANLVMSEVKEFIELS